MSKSKILKAPAPEDIAIPHVSQSQISTASGLEEIAIPHASKSQISKAFAPEDIAIPCASKSQISKTSAPEDIAIPCASTGKSQISKSSAPGEIAFADCDMPLDLSCSHSEASRLNDSNETHMKEETYSSVAERPLDLSMQPHKKKNTNL